MGAEVKQGAQMLLPIPASLSDQVAYDSARGVVYVERGTAGSPAFLSWQHRVEDSGFEVTFERLESDQVAKKRADGMRVHDAGDDAQLDNLQAAIALLVKAASYGASDLHFLIKGKHAEIQIEVNGGLLVLQRPSVSDAVSMMQAIYQGMSTDRDTQWKPLEFQNATISGEKFPPDSGIASARVVRGSCYPQHEGGQFMTVRLQYFSVGSNRRLNLQTLELPRAPEGKFMLAERGYQPDQVEKVRALMAYSTGAIWVSGPTGSGKTNTIFDIQQERARIAPDQRQVGVEDPVENPMPWMVQLSVNNTVDDLGTGRAFADRIRVMLRMAPKHLMVGEIRGAAAALAAIEAAITGHTLIASLHQPDPFLFVERLASMDRVRLDPKSFCDHNIIRGSISQRLVPLLCPDCCEPLKKHVALVEPRITSPLASWGDIGKVMVKGTDKGCKSCGGAGTKGRTAVAEVVLTDAALMRDLLEQGSEVARRNFRARPDADPSMLHRAMALVLDGRMDPRAVEKAVSPIVNKDVAE